jgi:F-type H+-transporting ATPase subunit b
VQFTPILAAVIDLDVTYFFQLVLFLGLVVVLNQVAFKPLLALFERRKAETEERERQASLGGEEADALQAQYDQAMAEATGDAMARRNAARDLAMSMQAERISQVRAESTQWLEAELKAHQEAVGTAREAALKEVASLSNDIVRTVTSGKGA